MQRKAIKLIEGWSTSSIKKRLREMGLFSPRSEEKALVRLYGSLSILLRKMVRDFLQGHVVIGEGIIALN